MSAVPAPSVRCGKCQRPIPVDVDRCPGCGVFTPGNRASLVHGAATSSDLAIETAKAVEELATALEGGPGLEARYVHARMSAARAIARSRLLAEYLERVGILDGRGRPRTSHLKLLADTEAAVLRWLDALACTPSAAARLGVDVARTQTLAEQLARQRKET
ncbi:MAG: hypothetical protein WEA10_06745 [Actinomycetota bacterium]